MSSESKTENQESEPSSSGCLQGERVSFTGTLASMTHRQAQQLAEQHGGTATVHVSKQTTMLVVGEEGWPLEPDGQPSQKLSQVTQWQHDGVEIRTLNESEWLHLLGLDDRQREVHRLYTPAMLSQLLDIPVGTIRGWERAGLIIAVRKVYRLPYFDFQEVTSARRLSELLAAGVSRKELEASLRGLRNIFGNIDRPLAQLEILARDSHLFYRDQHGLLEPVTGQRRFDFEPTAESLNVDETEPAVSIAIGQAEPSRDDAEPARDRTPDEWFQAGCRLAAEHELTAAVEAFRLCLMDKPVDAEVNFHLAEALVRLGRSEAALERYYAAVEADHDYLEAWTQLGCMHVEMDQLPQALDAFKIALALHPEYPDGHWHTASVLDQLGRTDEAVSHWQTYLKYDDRGPWAENARQRLEEAGGSQS